MAQTGAEETDEELAAAAAFLLAKLIS